jgi:hypothetical protein
LWLAVKKFQSAHSIKVSPTQNGTIKRSSRREMVIRAILSRFGVQAAQFEARSQRKASQLKQTPATVRAV